MVEGEDKMAEEDEMSANEEDIEYPLSTTSSVRRSIFARRLSSYR